MTPSQAPQAEGFETEILAKFAFRNPINRITCVRKPQTLNTLSVLVIACDKSSHGTSPRGEQSSTVGSRRRANGESVAKYGIFGPENRKTVGQYGRFVKAEKSEE